MPKRTKKIPDKGKSKKPPSGKKGFGKGKLNRASQGTEGTGARGPRKKG